MGDSIEVTQTECKPMVSIACTHNNGDYMQYTHLIMTDMKIKV